MVGPIVRIIAIVVECVRGTRRTVSAAGPVMVTRSRSRPRASRRRRYWMRRVRRHPSGHALGLHRERLSWLAQIWKCNKCYDNNNNYDMLTEFLTLPGCQQIIRKSVRRQITPGMIGEAVLWLAIRNRSRFTFCAEVRPQFVQRRRLFHRVHPGPLAVSAVGWYLIPILKEQYFV